MAKKLSLQEVIDHITDQENSEEETTEDESYSEDALQDILEEENITEQAETLQQLKRSNLLILRAQLKWCNILVEGWKFVLVIISNWEERQIIHRKCHKDDTRVDTNMPHPALKT